MNTYAGIYCKIVLTMSMLIAVFTAANVALAQRAPAAIFCSRELIRATSGTHRFGTAASTEFQFG